MPQKIFTGLAHHADWVPTLVAAAGGTLNDTVQPPPDGVNLWPALCADKDSSGPRDHIVVNVDATNQGTLNDINGWSGYAGIVVKSQTLGHYKLILGDPGTPNNWCWPNNRTEAAAGTQKGTATSSTTAVSVAKLLAASSGASIKNNDGGRFEVISTTDVTTGGNVNTTTLSIVARLAPLLYDATLGDKVVDWEANATAQAQDDPLLESSCQTLAGFTAISSGYEPYIDKTGGDSAGACCSACSGNISCAVWTWTGPGHCALMAYNKYRLRPIRCAAPCVTGNNAANNSQIPQPWRDPMPDPTQLSCGFNGHVPANRTGAILFNLATDLRETSNLADQHPEIVASLRAMLDPYIASAVPPLNEFASQRAADPRAKEAAKKAGGWVTWLP